jgi:CheY-like chemotaxis protein
VAERLRQIDPTLPVVLMTGSADPYTAASGLPVLRKPFPQEDLVAAVRRFAPTLASS